VAPQEAKESVVVERLVPAAAGGWEHLVGGGDIPPPVVPTNSGVLTLSQGIKRRRGVGRRRKGRKSGTESVSKADLEQVREMAAISRMTSHLLGESDPWIESFGKSANAGWVKVTLPLLYISQPGATAGGLAQWAYTSAGWTNNTDYTSLANTWEVCRTKRFKVVLQPYNQYDSGLVNVTVPIAAVRDLENATALTAWTGTNNTSVDEYGDEVVIGTSNNKFDSGWLVNPKTPPFDTLDPLSAPVARSWIKFFGNGFAANQASIVTAFAYYEVEFMGRA